MTKYYKCSHCEEQASKTYASLEIGDGSYFNVCQSCYVNLQNYFITVWAGQMISEIMEDRLKKIGL